MLLSGTVVADADTVVRDGAVVVAGAEIAAVGDRQALLDRYPDHEHRPFDILAPGLVNAHVHSVQTLARGVADDAALLDWLYDGVLPVEAAMDAEATRAAAALGYLECLAAGATTVLDHLSVTDADQAFEAAADLGIRARLGKAIMDRDPPAVGAGDLSVAGVGDRTVAGMGDRTVVGSGEPPRPTPPALLEGTEEALATSESLIRQYHGAADGRLRYAVTPRFVPACTEACLRGCRDLADAYDGVRIHTHAAEQAAEVRAVRAAHGMGNVAWLDEVGLTGPDVTLAHCVHLDREERALLAATDTRVVHCPSANMKLASGIAPVPAYRDRGVTVGIGNDGPPCNNVLDPLSELRQAALLGKLGAEDAAALPAREAFRMATEGGAIAAGFPEVGTMREGAPADVIGLTTDVAGATPVHDPISHLVHAAHGDDVRFTMVDGDVVYADGEHVGVDAAAVRREAVRHADRIVTQAVD